jgi:hypothetical protein
MLDQPADDHPGHTGRQQHDPDRTLGVADDVPDSHVASIVDGDQHHGGDDDSSQDQTGDATEIDGRAALTTGVVHTFPVPRHDQMRTWHVWNAFAPGILERPLNSAAATKRGRAVVLESPVIDASGGSTVRIGYRGKSSHLVNIDVKVPEGTSQMAMCRSTVRLGPPAKVERGTSVDCRTCSSRNAARGTG